MQLDWKTIIALEISIDERIFFELININISIYKIYRYFDNGNASFHILLCMCSFPHRLTIFY